MGNSSSRRERDNGTGRAVHTQENGEPSTSMFQWVPVLSGMISYSTPLSGPTQPQSPRPCDENGTGTIHTGMESQSQQTNSQDCQSSSEAPEDTTTCKALKKTRAENEQNKTKKEQLAALPHQEVAREDQLEHRQQQRQHQISSDDDQNDNTRDNNGRQSEEEESHHTTGTSRHTTLTKQSSLLPQEEEDCHSDEPMPNVHCGPTIDNISTLTTEGTEREQQQQTTAKDKHEMEDTEMAKAPNTTDDHVVSPPPDKRAPANASTNANVTEVEAEDQLLKSQGNTTTMSSKQQETGAEGDADRIRAPWGGTPWGDLHVGKAHEVPIMIAKDGHQKKQESFIADTTTAEVPEMNTGKKDSQSTSSDKQENSNHETETAGLRNSSTSTPQPTIGCDNSRRNSSSSIQQHQQHQQQSSNQKHHDADDSVSSSTVPNEEATMMTLKKKIRAEKARMLREHELDLGRLDNEEDSVYQLMEQDDPESFIPHADWRQRLQHVHNERSRLEQDFRRQMLGLHREEIALRRNQTTTTIMAQQQQAKRSSTSSLDTQSTTYYTVAQHEATTDAAGLQNVTMEEAAGHKSRQVRDEQDLQSTTSQAGDESFNNATVAQKGRVTATGCTPVADLHASYTLMEATTTRKRSISGVCHQQNDDEALKRRCLDHGASGSALGASNKKGSRNAVDAVVSETPPVVADTGSPKTLVDMIRKKIQENSERTSASRATCTRDSAIEASDTCTAGTHRAMDPPECAPPAEKQERSHGSSSSDVRPDQVGSMNDVEPETPQDVADEPGECSGLQTEGTQEQSSAEKDANNADSSHRGNDHHDGRSDAVGEGSTAVSEQRDNETDLGVPPAATRDNHIDNTEVTKSAVGAREGDILPDSLMAEVHANEASTMSKGSDGSHQEGVSMSPSITSMHTKPESETSHVEDSLGIRGLRESAVKELADVRKLFIAALKERRSTGCIPGGTYDYKELSHVMDMCCYPVRDLLASAAELDNRRIQHLPCVVAHWEDPNKEGQLYWGPLQCDLDSCFHPNSRWGLCDGEVRLSLALKLGLSFAGVNNAFELLNLEQDSRTKREAFRDFIAICQRSLLASLYDAM